MHDLSEWFAPMTYKDWKNLAEKEVSGPLERTWENISLRRYFTKEDRNSVTEAFSGHVGYAEKQAGDVRSWDNIPRISDENVKRANGHALTALMEGADGLLFPEPGRFETDSLLADIMPDYAALCFTETDDSFASSFRRWLDRQDSDHQKVRGFLAPAGSRKEDLASLFKLFRDYKSIRFFHFDLAAPHAGYTEQLSVFLANLADGIDNLLETGMSLAEIWQRLVISVSCSPLFFEEIARLRAVRILAFKMFRAYGLEDIAPANVLIHAISPDWKEESFQPHGNMLKGCTTALAGILGGCTALTILPEDDQSEMQQRIARNVSLILKEECFMDKVADPAAGSYYIETLTDVLARNAWNAFSNAN